MGQGMEIKRVAIFFGTTKYYVTFEFRYSKALPVCVSAQAGLKF